MGLIEHDLFDGKIDKVAIAIERLKTFEPKEGYYLAFSGGKDSVVIKALADMSGVKYDAHYSNTTIDPPELIYFIRKQHKDVKIEHPEKPLLKVLETKGFPLRQARWCCALYKENGGDGRFVMTGVRKAESNKRSKRKMVESCYKSSGKQYMNVIIDWTAREVWEFIKSRDLPYCELYDKGFKRIGCLMCPMASKRERERECEAYPGYKKAFIRSFNKLYAHRGHLPSFDRWHNGEEMFNWWIKGSGKGNPDQTIMFE